MNPVAGPDAGPVHSRQFLHEGRTHKNQKSLGFTNLAFPVRSPVAAASAKLFSAPENLAANSEERRFAAWLVSLQQADRTYRGRGIMKTTFAPPTNASTFSICFRQDLKAEGGKLKVTPQVVPSILFGFFRGDGQAVLSSTYSRKPEFDNGSIATVSNSVRFNFSRVSQNFNFARLGGPAATC